MPKKLPVLKAREVVRALEQAGFYVHHQTGSHARLLHSAHPDRRVTVPIHSKDVPLPLLKRILQQAGLTLEEFMEFL